jgi:hypothetical protein
MDSFLSSNVRKGVRRPAGLFGCWVLLCQGSSFIAASHWICCPPLFCPPLPHEFKGPALASSRRRWPSAGAVVPAGAAIRQNTLLGPGPGSLALFGQSGAGTEETAKRRSEHWPRANLRCFLFLTPLNGKLNLGAGRRPSGERKPAEPTG